MIDFIRTPENRFERLANYKFDSNYVDIKGLRMHYVDQGSTDADPILMLHGEPTWSYLYRHMIPVCAAAGHRVIAPDLIGFGKSDKPTNIRDYSYKAHMDWLTAFIQQLDLKRITLVCQDWGALLGLRLAAENSERFKAIVVGNGFLLTGKEKLPKALKIWQAFAAHSPWFPIGKIVNSGCFKSLSKDEQYAYNAPFPNRKYKVAARAFPRLIPMSLQDEATTANQQAWEILEQWEKPFLTAFSNGDPITRGAEKIFHKLIPGCKAMPHAALKGGHFLQEDSGTEFAETINLLLRSISEKNDQST